DVGPGVTLWVNANTFLPVRLVLSPVEHADFGWLKPTAANLVTLRVNVPAGLHEVRLPAGATVDWAAGAVRTRELVPTQAVGRNRPTAMLCPGTLTGNRARSALQDRDPAQVPGSPAGAVGCAADRVELAGVEGAPVQPAVEGNVRAGQADRDNR